jgi:hypothetical protein
MGKNLYLWLNGRILIKEVRREKRRGEEIQEMDRETKG